MTNKKYLIIIVALFAVGILMAMLLGRPVFLNKTNSEKPTIAVSFYPLGYFAKEIVGEKMDIITITPFGAEPHDYEPTAFDLIKINRSRLLVLNGGGFEPWAEKFRKQFDSKVKIVFVSDGLTGKENAQGQSIADPHVWLDPILSQKLTERIYQQIITIDPNNRSFYHNRFELMTNRLNRLDEEFQKELSECKTKTFITSHTAFFYLAKRYGLIQLGINGIFPDEEPSARKLKELKDLLKRENTKIIFYENMLSPKLAVTLAGEIGAKVLVLDPLEGVSSENLRMGKNYFSIMKENLMNLKEALQCK